MKKEPTLIRKKVSKLEYKDRVVWRSLYICPFCENEFEAVPSTVNTGKTQSCGCLRIKHRGVGTGTYKTWQAMKYRCDKSSSKDYSHYGGRGIKYTSEWSNFSAFLKDMGDRPDGHTLDRIDSDGNYTLKNCRWATYKTQTRNRRKHTRLTLKGETKCIGEWSEVLGIPDTTIHSRMKAGWSEEESLLGRKK